MTKTASARKGLAVFLWAFRGFGSRKFQQNTPFF
jgi:hypothetical protein